MDEKIRCISCPRARFRIKAGAFDALSLVLGSKCVSGNFGNVRGKEEQQALVADAKSVPQARLLLQELLSVPRAAIPNQ